MLLILKKKILDMTVPRFCMGLICGRNPFQPLRLEWSYPLLLLLWGQSDPRISGLCERPKYFSITLHIKTQVYGRLPSAHGWGELFIYIQIHIKFINQGE